MLPSSLQNLDPKVAERFREIVQVPAKFDTPKEQEACETIVEQLSSDELESAANISYAYWALSKLEDSTASNEAARNIALKIARWHLQYVGGAKNSSNTNKALKRLQQALEIRKERKMELFRTIFDSDATLTDEEESLKQAVTNDMGKQMQILRGQDKDGRAVVIKVSRTHGGTTEYDYVTQQLFVAEKSAAVTEFVSKGHQDTVCAIFSMQNQNSSYTPSLAWQLSVIKLLQQIAPGRMGRVLILEASFMIRQIFNAIRPFLSVSLKESTFLVAGKAREAKLKETLDDYEILTKDGELTKPVDVNKYLNETPFYCPYEYSV